LFRYLPFLSIKKNGSFCKTVYIVKVNQEDNWVSESKHNLIKGLNAILRQALGRYSAKAGSDAYWVSTASLISTPSFLSTWVVRLLKTKRISEPM